jgi:hypothetical protein
MNESNTSVGFSFNKKTMKISNKNTLEITFETLHDCVWQGLDMKERRSCTILAAVQRNCDKISQQVYFSFELTLRL